ncbi:helix-turn-helix domain-containing protein [Natrarchaeobaculum sulfurireducens]|uniref:hypothetical protein n=1 Tax=Natrarchaeobaculum sulfurireducens TaxID=2044521 RepID=UPI00105AB05A|nr:hypothetical protein [Natrarchaeobaculum sulfurireducens]
MPQDDSSSATHLGGEDASGQMVKHGVDPDRLANLRAILIQPKVRLLQQILASPTGALSAVELAARNEITESTIRDHLRNLQSRDPEIVTALEADASPVPNGIPRKYYAVTEYGIGLLQQVNMHDQIGILYDMYEAAELELPDSDERSVTITDIEEYEHRPLPDWL